MWQSPTEKTAGLTQRRFKGLWTSSPEFWEYVGVVTNVGLKRVSVSRFFQTVFNSSPGVRPRPSRPKMPPRLRPNAFEVSFPDEVSESSTAVASSGQSSQTTYTRSTSLKRTSESLDPVESRVSGPFSLFLSFDCLTMSKLTGNQTATASSRYTRLYNICLDTSLEHY